MYRSKRLLFLTFLVISALGSLLHFWYEWMPSPLTALFSPVNESLWEHVKLIYWPYLLGALFLSQRQPGGLRPWLAMPPILCGLMLWVGWLIHVTFGYEALWADLVLYFSLMALGFWLPTRFSGDFRGPLRFLPATLTTVLGGLIIWFTFRPPAHLLFMELS